MRLEVLKFIYANTYQRSYWYGVFSTFDYNAREELRLYTGIIKGLRI